MKTKYGNHPQISRFSGKKRLKYGNELTEIELGGKIYRFKSKSEARYAAYLEWLKSIGHIDSWEYEPQKFAWLNRLGNKVQYVPDFCVRSHQDREETIIYYEVKGYMTSEAKAKISGFQKNFPNLNLIVIDAAWFRRNTKKLKGLVKGWI